MKEVEKRDDDEKNEEVVRGNNEKYEGYGIVEPHVVGELSNERKVFMASILTSFQHSLCQRTQLNLGYGYNYDYDYSAFGELQNCFLNNIGDPFIESQFHGHSRQFEVSVLDWFARLWEIDNDDYWGYVSNGGTEGNLHGILLGRELFPDGILYTSKESHYTVFKIARMYRMECVEIEAYISGEIDCDDLRDKLLHNKEKSAILCLTLGTPIKGAVDDVDRVISTLEACGFQEDKFYIHLDGANYGLMLPLLKGVTPKISFKKPIGSISVSGHKFIGCPMPCGIQMTRKRHIHALSNDVEYMKSRDCSIMCSRNGHIPIYLWYALNRKGYCGFERDAEKCLRNAKYLKDLLKAAGVSVMLNRASNFVAMERPPDDDFIRRWQLPCVGGIVRVTVMPSDTIQKLDIFYQQLLKSRSTYYEDGAKQPPCVAPQIGIDNCACLKHK